MKPDNWEKLSIKEIMKLSKEDRDKILEESVNQYLKDLRDKKLKNK